MNSSVNDLKWCFFHFKSRGHLVQMGDVDTHNFTVAVRMGFTEGTASPSNTRNFLKIEIDAFMFCSRYLMTMEICSCNMNQLMAKDLYLSAYTLEPNCLLCRP